MNRGTNPAANLHPAGVRAFAAFLGGGAATNCTVPSNGPLLSSASTYPKGANLASTGTYVSTGVYTCVLTEQAKHILFADAVVVDAGASPTAALKAVVTAIEPTTKTITVKVYTPSGTLTDLGTSDLLILAVDLADTTAIG